MMGYQYMIISWQQVVGNEDIIGTLFQLNHNNQQSHDKRRETSPCKCHPVNADVKLLSA